MPPRFWLPRRSWRLEHNQCHSLYLFPAFSVAARLFSQNIFLPRDLLRQRSPPFNKNWEQPFKQDLTGSIREALTGSLKE
jgi:hypothetical protein